VSKISSFGVGVMLLNSTFINILVISWRSVLLVKETGVPGENHQSVASHWQTLSHNVVSSTPHHCRKNIIIFVIRYRYATFYFFRDNFLFLILLLPLYLLYLLFLNQYRLKFPILHTSLFLWRNYIFCLTPLSTIFQLYRGGQFYWWRKPLTCRKSLTNFIT
jgi:hypothetical protein